MSQEFSDFEVVSQIIVVLFLKLPILLYKLLVLHLLLCQSNLLSLSTACLCFTKCQGSARKSTSFMQDNNKQSSLLRKHHKLRG